MTFRGKYILAAIDGTDSTQFRRDGLNSHVGNFHRDFNTQGGMKDYFDGPGELMGGTIHGRGTEGILGRVVTFINTASRIYARRNIPHRICLVGHSRGGLIAINAARLAREKVHFLGLYDAVDRHAGLAGDTISNVDYTYHAVRDPSVDSRSSFGNTGRPETIPGTHLNVSGGWYYEQLYLTSHGGLGGEVAVHPHGFSEDISCSADTLTANIALALSNYDIAQTCIDQAEAADQWIRDRAHHRGLRLH